MSDGRNPMKGTPGKLMPTRFMSTRIAGPDHPTMDVLL